MPNIRWLLALVTRVQRFLYLKTGGAVGASIGGMQILLLTSVGRRTGHQRITPLLYVEDGERLVVVASNAGDDRHPAWWYNLEQTPNARVQIRREHREVLARRATPEEAERLWPTLVAAYRPYEDYRRRTGREIPIVLLEPAPPPA
ncbi:MAG: nitroreductase family deazaflavin-dependent oxidoreductase [Myxococcota bacterium]